MLQLLLDKSQEGTRIVYIPGNHDHELHAVRRRQIRQHRNRHAGDPHDAHAAAGCSWSTAISSTPSCAARSLGVRSGGFACRRLLTLNRFVHWLHDLLDRPYWSLAQHVKSRFPGAQGYIERFQRATLAAARAAHVDGVVCGHIHRADLTDVDGLLYCNDGDWVESCTALVEDQAGELSLLEWRPTAATIAAAAGSISVWADAATSRAASEQEAA